MKTHHLTLLSLLPLLTLAVSDPHDGPHDTDTDHDEPHNSATVSIGPSPTPRIPQTDDCPRLCEDDPALRPCSDEWLARIRACMEPPCNRRWIQDPAEAAGCPSRPAPDVPGDLTDTDDDDTTVTRTTTVGGGAGAEQTESAWATIQTDTTAWMNNNRTTTTETVAETAATETTTTGVRPTGIDDTPGGQDDDGEDGGDGGENQDGGDSAGSKKGFTWAALFGGLVAFVAFV